MIHMPMVPNHQWNNDWIQCWQLSSESSVCQTEWFTMSKTVWILIKRTQTAMIVLGSPQVFVFQLALLNHLQRTVTGQRMRGYEGGDEEELVVEEKTGRHLFDSRALQSAKLEPLPNNAADFRVWKSSLISMLGRLDISVSLLGLPLPLKVGSTQECSDSSGLVPRLGPMVCLKAHQRPARCSGVAIQGPGLH